MKLESNKQCWQFCWLFCYLNVVNSAIYLQLKGSDNGWWYVNLRGFEGYVPGAYWEPVPSKTAPSPATRHRTPQPVPRTHSPVPPPCQPITSIVTTVATTTASTVSTTSAPLIERNSMESELWYHGKMSRPQSEKKLSNFGNGVFLIRESVNRVSSECRT